MTLRFAGFARSPAAWGLGIILIAVALAFVFCSDEPTRIEGPVYRDSGAIEGGTLHRRLAGNPANLDPFFIGTRDKYELEVLPLLYDELLGTDRDLNLDFTCALAESAEVADDRRSVLVRLKPDRRWHDGAPLSVADFLFAVELLRAEDTPANLKRAHRLRDLESVERVDERTMRIRFSRPLAEWKSAANLRPFPRHLIEPELRAASAAGKPWDATESRAVVEMVGSGPYRLVERREGVGIILERWEDYPGPKVWIDRIVLHVIQDAGAALNAYLAGEIDEMLLRPDQLRVPSVVESLGKRGKLVGTDTWSLALMFWNLREPPLDDPAVRRALAMAVKTSEIIDTLLAGEAVPASGFFPPRYEGHDPAGTPIAHDPAGAAALLEQAGFRRETGKPWIRDGKPLVLEIVHRSSDRSTQIAAALQADLAEIGVTLRLRSLESATLNERARDRDFQGLLTGFDLPVAPGMTVGYWHSGEAESGSNYSGIADESIDAWYDEAAVEFEDGARRALYHKIDRRLAELQPALFLWHPRRTYAVSDRVGGFIVSVRGPHAFHPGPRGWWVRDAVKREAR